MLVPSWPWKEIRKERGRKGGREARSQRDRGLLSPAVLSSRHLPGLLGLALVSSGRQGSEDCLLAGFSFFPPFFPPSAPWVMVTQNISHSEF